MKTSKEFEAEFNKIFGTLARQLEEFATQNTRLVEDVNKLTLENQQLTNQVKSLETAQQAQNRYLLFTKTYALPIATFACGMALAYSQRPRF